MIIDLNDAEDLTLRGFDDEGLSVESTAPDLMFGPMEMLAASMALCTYSMLAHYAAHKEIGTGELQIRVRWDYADKPYRIEPVEMDIHWPELPASRRDAARRAAEQCTIHHTLQRPTTVRTRVETEPPERQEELPPS